MSFDGFVCFVKSINLCELDNTPSFENRDEDKARIRGGTDEDLLSRIQNYQNDFETAYSEKSAYGSVINILHPYSILRILAENPLNRDEYVVWNYGSLVSNGWSKINDITTETDRLDTFLVATEGSSDAHILEKALGLLRPDIKDFFKFIDMKSGHPFSGTGNLLKFADGLVKIDVQNLIVFVLDNDCEGIEAFNKIRKLELPKNMTCMHLPNLEGFNSFPAYGPHGVTREDINGRAVAIECYLDLNYSGHEEAVVIWTNYKKESDAYQGLLDKKEYYTKRFMSLKENTIAYDNYDFSKITQVLNVLIKTCSDVSAAIRFKKLEELYPEGNE